MIDRQWLQELKAGDQVCVNSGFGSEAYQTLTVTKITATQIVCDNYLRYAKKDGYALGSRGYSRSHIEQVTDRVRAAILRSRLMFMMQRGRLDSLNLQDLQTVKAIFEQAEARAREVKP
ncbi:hypothetical protein UFOVP119_57 [uncultured Caudovirales phage]|uniref:Uncharacterized protein n=1 Tax=uncultured Caudovirales phage TaxID=2100421 RepID=A0A6J5LAW7_9CAUD|nr:hypothetical protein UFOVP119_57 [uncultured Caudovirales phage]